MRQENKSDSIGPECNGQLLPHRAQKHVGVGHEWAIDGLQEIAADLTDHWPRALHGPNLALTEPLNRAYDSRVGQEKPT